MKAAFINLLHQEVRQRPYWIVVALGVWLILMLSSWPSYGAPVEQLPDNSKIVVVGGSLTEIVFALSAQDRMIGRDTTSLYPLEAQKIKDVGYMRTLSSEGILSLAPDGILLVEGSGPPTTLEVLQKASVPMVFVPDKYDQDSVLEKIRIVGHALHKDKEAEQLISQVSQQFDSVKARTKDIQHKKKVLFILSMQNGRIMAAGRDTAADGMINLAGGVNAINAFSGYKTLNDEAVISAAPDQILMMKNGGRSVAIEEVLDNPAIASTEAGKNKAIHQIDGLYLLGFGPRTAQAAQELNARLYGQKLNDE